MRLRMPIVFILTAVVVSGCGPDSPAGPGEIPTLATVQAMPLPEVIPLPTGFQPEGIATGIGSEFFVGSFISGAVYRGDLRTGAGSVLVPPDPGNRMVLGLWHDARSDLLFAAGGLMGAGHVFDARTGAHVASYQFAMPCDPPCTLVNDVVVARDAAYFTDSFWPAIYRVPLGAAGELPDPPQFQVLPLGGEFTFDPVCPSFPFPVNANGIVATPDGKVLVIVNLCTGSLYKVDPQTGYATQIDLGGASIAFGDGIVLDGKTLYVVQNLLNQIAIVDLSPDLSAGVVSGFITSPYFRIPATAAEFGGSLYAVNARFDVSPPGVPTPDVEVEVVRVPKR